MPRRRSKKMRAGRCAWCESEAFKDGCLCERHLIINRERMRELRGCGEWVRGNKGRPPVEERAR